MDERVVLQQTLQSGLDLRTKLSSNLVDKSNYKSVVKRFLDVSTNALEQSKKLKHGHGFGLALELHATALMFSFDADPDIAIKLSTTNEKEEEKCISEFWKNVLSEINLAKKVAQSYNDVSLGLRILETMANIHKAIDDVPEEVAVLETAVAIKRAPSLIIALLDAYKRYLEKLHTERPETTQDQLSRSVEENEKILEIYLKYWSELCWLEEQEQKHLFDFKAFVTANHSIVFRVCIYIGTVMAHPFLSDNGSNLLQAGKAFDLAKFIATSINDKNYMCSLAANQTRAFNIHFKADERKRKIEELRKLQEDLKPETEEITQLLAELECPNGCVPSHLADIPPEQLKQLVQEAQEGKPKEESGSLDLLAKLK